MTFFAPPQGKQKQKGDHTAQSPGQIGTTGLGFELMSLQTNLGNSSSIALIADKFNDVVPQASTFGNSVGGSKELRGLSSSPQDKRGAGWYIEMEPASPIITAGTEVTFRLEKIWRGNSLVQSEYGNYPAFMLFDENGTEVKCSTRIDHFSHSQDFFSKYTTLNKPGHYRASFRGKSFGAAGSIEHPYALYVAEGEFLVSLDFDVLGDLAPKTLAGLSAQTTAASDMKHLEDPDATDGEVATAFERISIRRGFDVLEANRLEAEDQIALYTKGTDTKSSTQTTEDLKKIVDLDDALKEESSRLRLSEGMILRAQNKGRKLQSYKDMTEFVKEEKERIALSRLFLVEAFPALTIVTRNPEIHTAFHRNPEHQKSLIEFGLRRVLDDIEKTKSNLASGELSILRVETIINHTRSSLAIDSDERKSRAIDRLLKEHAAEETKAGLAVGAASLLLLFTPGIGPYLSAAVGGTWAARSWVRFGELHTAAGAGVREGIVARKDVLSAGFWSLFDTFFAVFDLSSALGSTLRAAKTVAPHVPEAASRLAERTAGATGKVVQSSENAAEILPELGPAIGKGEKIFSVTEKPFSMTADELTDLAAMLFRRPVKPMAGEVHFYESMKEYANEFKRYWPDLPVPAGYRNPNTGHIHISPRAGLMTAIHEAVHKVSRETFPMGRQVLGDFLDEGITEAITRVSLGPRAASHPYDVHVKFVEVLQEKLGETGASVVKNGVLQPGGYRSLRDAVKRLFGGSEQKTFEFFNRVRSIGSDASGAVKSQQALDEAFAMLEGSGGKNLVPTVPVAKPPSPVIPKKRLPEIEPGDAPLSGNMGSDPNILPAPSTSRQPSKTVSYHDISISELDSQTQLKQSVFEPGIDRQELKRRMQAVELLAGDGYVYTLGDFPDIAPRPLAQPKVAPPSAHGNRSRVGRSKVQNIDVRADKILLEQAGVEKKTIKVNQMHSDAEGLYAGWNRPDVQGTLPNGQRIYIEYDRSPPNRALDHARRILENDPTAIVILKVVDFE